MAENESKANEPAVVLPYELAKIAAKWITRILALFGVLLSAYIATNKDAGEHVSKRSSDDDAGRIERLEALRDNQQAKIVDLSSSLSACKQQIADQEQFRVVTSSRRR